MPNRGDLAGAYAAGALAGYAARCAEESAEWAERSAPAVLVDGQFYNRPTAAERLAERTEILRQAHWMKLHDHRPAACPLCREGWGDA